MSVTETLAATHLGKKSAGSEKYDKSLLVAVPRIENRTAYGIEEDKLPFVGYDVWNAYEVSFMTTNNIPCMYVLKIKYPCNSPFIVESKSLKLYLNSFNMTPLKDTIEESTEYFLTTVKHDLEELLQTTVELYLHKTYSKSKCKMFKGYTNLSKLVDMNSLHCDKFNEAPEILSFDESNANKELKITFDSMRSNCRVTHQPDFADAFIRIKCKDGVDLENLTRYLISFRKEWHFHEECVEMIFKRLLDKYKPEVLMVGALYTRRGGIDICPMRALNEDLLDKELITINKYTKKTIKQ